MPGEAEIISAVQTTAGIIQSMAADARNKKYLAQRTTYKTPEEYNKILQATQNAAQQGYDAFTLNYLTNQTDRAFDSSIDAATRLGGNPNDLSALFDQKLQSLMKIGANNHALNMENISKYLGALDTMAASKTAEWQSAQDLLKDKMQSASAEKAAGVQNIGSGLNGLISTNAASQTQDLYKQMQDALVALQKGQLTTGGGSPSFNPRTGGQ